MYDHDNNQAVTTVEWEFCNYVLLLIVMIVIL